MLQDHTTPPGVQIEGVVQSEIVGSGDAARVRFRLTTSSGLSPIYECDPIKLGAVQTDLQLLFAKATRKLVPTEALGRSLDVVFDTNYGEAMMLQGPNYSGQFVFLFRTTAGHSLATGIGPNLAQSFYEALRLGLSGLEQKPQSSDKNLFTAMFVPGEQKSVGKPIEAFGQIYPADLVTELGIFLIRANLLERSMIRLLREATGVNDKTASALFYSTVNVRARITMIQAAIAVITLEPSVVALVEKALSTTSQVTQRRNRLVHGFWSFKKDKFEVESFEPTKALDSQNEIVTAKSLRILTSDYYNAGLLVEAAADKLSRSVGRPQQGVFKGDDQEVSAPSHEVRIPEPNG